MLAITGDLNLGSIGFEGGSPKEILDELGMGFLRFLASLYGLLFYAYMFVGAQSIIASFIMEWLGRKLFIESTISHKSRTIFILTASFLGAIAIIPAYLILWPEGLEIMFPVMGIGGVVGFLGSLILLRSWRISAK